MRIKFTHKGDFRNTERFFNRSKSVFDKYDRLLHEYGRIGVIALAANTPKDTGETAASWDYKITKTKNSCRITWTNSKMAGGTPVVILLHYGHGTGTGGYVEGVDFINPITKVMFENWANELWAEVTK